jgi:hypothetical protein
MDVRGEGAEFGYEIRVEHGLAARKGQAALPVSALAPQAEIPEVLRDFFHERGRGVLLAHHFQGAVAANLYAIAAASASGVVKDMDRRRAGQDLFVRSFLAGPDALHATHAEVCAEHELGLGRVGFGIVAPPAA